MIKITRYRYLLLIPLIILLTFGFAGSVRADLPVSEGDLNPAGYAYEINADEQGWLWITDSDAFQVWGVNPSTGAYDVYPVAGTPIDARRSGDWLWWADVFSNLLGRISTTDGSYIQWEVPDVSGFLGTSLDSSGRLFATDSFNPYLYRLDPVSNELCAFSLPTDGPSNYMVRHGNDLWLGDWYDAIILRIDLTDNNLTYWSLPEGSAPLGIAVDSQGNLWYVDQGNILLAELNPNTNQLQSFSLPSGDSPQMIAVQSSFIWYTEQSLASIGRLDPMTASHTDLTLNPVTQTLEPSCETLDPSSTGSVEVSSGMLSWSNASYSTQVNTGGWRVYQMPEDSSPYGISIPELGYVVDNGRQELVRFTPPTESTLNVIKHVINDDGGTAIASDFTITVDNPGADPASFPGAESPGTQVTLTPGAYSVSEAGLAGYSATYSADCSGTIALGQVKTCTITNDDQPAYITVEKVVNNTHGGTALPDDFLLTLDGEPVLSGVAVPVDPGTYTAAETLLPGYAFMGFSGDCNSSGEVTIASGESKTCTLTNADTSQKSYLPILIR